MGILRLILALVVANGHMTFICWYPNGLWLPENRIKMLYFGPFAVIFFYVISGFLISYTLSRKYNANREGTLRFYRGRFVRIFSLYWPVLLLILLFVPRAWTMQLKHGPLDWMTNIVLIGIDTRLLLDADDRSMGPFLPQTWTLGVELGFYLIAPFVLRSWRTSIAVAIASFGWRMAMLALGVTELAPTYYFVGSSLIFFLIGHFARETGDAFAQAKHPLVAFVALPAAAMFISNEPYMTFDTVSFWFAVICFGASLPSLFAVTRDSRFMNFLGDLSYPAYLVHVVLISQIYIHRDSIAGLLGASNVDTIKAALATSPWDVLAALTVASSIAVVITAIVTHYCIEVPFDRLFHAAFNKFTGRTARCVDAR
jgi:peptidoglycan/LPS O-acetylase OafA/YrhL